MPDTLLGLHHVTALAGDPQRNLDFYTGFLGLRLVKRTVNFDDPGTHHFYFGDATGSPGTLLTFFPGFMARRARRGSGQAVAVAFTAGALADWKARAEAARVEWSGPVKRLGEQVLTLRDPDGLALELVESGSNPQIYRLHSVTICDADFPLAPVLGFDRAGAEENRVRYEMAGGAGRIDVLHEPEAERGRMGPGAIHHIALGAAGCAQQDEWRAKLMAAGYRVSLPADRRYFRSIYFRQPASATGGRGLLASGQTASPRPSVVARLQSGVLFEIATTSPGFTVDESEQELGRTLCLPPWLETQRGSIESRLPSVRLDRFRG